MQVIQEPVCSGTFLTISSIKKDPEVKISLFHSCFNVFFSLVLVCQEGLGCYAVVPVVI